MILHSYITSTIAHILHACVFNIVLPEEHHQAGVEGRDVRLFTCHIPRDDDRVRIRSPDHRVSYTYGIPISYLPHTYKWYHSGTTQVQLRYSSGTTQVQLRYNSGTTQVQFPFSLTLERASLLTHLTMKKSIFKKGGLS